MSWVVDTCVVIDVLDVDSEHDLPSAQMLNSMLFEGLVLCPVCFVELAPSFDGDLRRQCDFFETAGIDYKEAWLLEDTYLAHAAWQRQIRARHDKKAPRRPLADILIGAFSMRYEGLVTRNSSDFADIFPSLAIRVP